MRKFTFLLLLFVRFVYSNDLERKYALKIDLNDASGRIYPIQTSIELNNTSNQELTHVDLVLYPNRYQESLKPLDDLNYHQFYPYGFSRGAFEVSWVKVFDRMVSFSYVHKQEIIRVKFEKPIEKNEKVQITVDGFLKVPEKFGSFGWYKGTLFLLGGFHPMVPVLMDDGSFDVSKEWPLANWEIQIKSSKPAMVEEILLRQRDHEETVLLNNRRMISVFSSEKIIKHQVENVEFYLTNREPKKFLLWLDRVSLDWLRFVESKKMSCDVRFIQAPSRDSIIKLSDHVSYFSDRMFKLINPLKKYHAIVLWYAMFNQCLVDKIQPKSGYDHRLVQVLSWYWVDQFIETMNIKDRDARNIKALRFFSFIPSIDQLIFSPQFAFVDAFYNSIYPNDPIKDHPIEYYSMYRNPRTIYEKLKDYLTMGELKEVLQNMPTDFESSKHRLDQLLFNKDVSSNQIFLPQPMTNYRLQKHKHQKVNGKHHHELLIRKESKTVVKEPVEILVEEKNNQKHLFIWNDSNEQRLLDFELDTKVKRISIDPRYRLLESKRSDNDQPKRYKFLLTELIMNYDFNENQPIAIVSSQIRKIYEGYDRYNFHFNYFGETYGGGVSYTRLFGRLVDHLRLSHGLNVGLNASHFDQDLSLAIDESSGLGQVVQVGDSGLNTSVTLSYFTGSQLSLTNPLQGGGFSLWSTFGLAALGGKNDYYQVGTAASWILPFHPNYFAALRASLMHSGPEDVPTFVQPRLGGILGIRGLSFVDDRYAGKNMFLSSAEFRHLLKQDLDINLGLFRVRMMQGALFGDIGSVSDTVLQKANRQAFGSNQSVTSFEDLFDPGQWQYDVGYGLRFHVEYLGVNPALIRFDVAKHLNEDSPMRFYFGVTQSF